MHEGKSGWGAHGIILIQEDVLELHYIASYLCHGWTEKVMKTKLKDRFWAQALQIGFEYIPLSDYNKTLYYTQSMIHCVQKYLQIGTPII